VKYLLRKKKIINFSKKEKDKRSEIKIIFEAEKQKLWDTQVSARCVILIYIFLAREKKETKISKIDIYFYYDCFRHQTSVDAIEMFRDTFAQNWILIFYWNIYRTTVRHNKFVNNWNESFCWTWMSYQAMLSCFNLGASCWFRVKLFDLTFMTSFRGKYEYF